MQDALVNFPLRSPLIEELSLALARTHAEFNRTRCDSLLLEKFVHDADVAGIRARIEIQARQGIYEADAMGLFKPSGKPATITFEEAIEASVPKIVDRNMETALRGAKLATAVLLHNASDVFFWRLIRFGLVYEREGALKLVADRKVSIAEIQGRSSAEATDAAIDAWWWQFERKSLPEKWDKCVSLLGYPVGLSRGTWHFDRDVLKEFDDVRHEAVHHDGNGLLTFDLESFSYQLSRTAMIWMTHICALMEFKISAEEMFGLHLPETT